MGISFSEIMNLNGESREFTSELGFESFEYMGNQYPVVSKTPVKLRLNSVGPKSVLLEAQASLLLSAPCDRCLEPVELNFNLDLKHVYKFSPDGTACVDDDEETVSYIDSYELDVDQLVNEEVMIGFPMKVLCSDECKGICSVCGANLNRGECGCDRTVLDPRMSIIRDLFQQKEV